MMRRPQTLILDGKLLAQVVQGELTRAVAELTLLGKPTPGLGVILVGSNPASRTYVGNKKKMANGCGIVSFDAELPDDASFEDVAAAIKNFNEDKRVDGILLQLPLPKHLDSDRLIGLIDPAKDSDGLHSNNQGRLFRGEKGVRPCTPLGILKLIDLALSGISLSEDLVNNGRLEIPEQSLQGKRVVIVGRSTLVGRPVALMLLERHATVTIAHSKTADLPAVCREADILVAAVGVPLLVKGSWVKKGAIVIDVGINRMPISSSSNKGKLVGDVDFDEVKEVAAAITPVPGGVGPMTVAMLLANTLSNYKMSRS